jgi:nitroimidazol reductase NimA-like FMN-containing flavoprotein (pyridoxamine 5'-phosphate oxidase superfamily)
MAQPPTERARVHRHPERATYDRGAIDAILDEALTCDVAWVDPAGRPRVLPTIHARVGETLYLHGSRAARPWKALRDGVEVAVSATIVDGLVLARSAFAHSMNYRSAVVYGRAREVTDPDELLVAARAITDHVAPGRAEDARMPTAEEYRQTLLLALPIDEASAKVRTGPPKDEDEDVPLPVWAGVLPLRTAAGEPEPAPDLADGIGVPPYVRAYHRPGRGAGAAPR